MIRALFTMAVTTTLLMSAGWAPPAEAASREEREKRQEKYRPKRVPGGRTVKEVVVIPISGWRLGTTVTFPYSLGFHAGYLFPAEPVTWKLGGSWGIWSDRGMVAFQGSDFRLYGALVYDLAPGIEGGPFVETGLDYIRTSGAVLPLSWPVVPHIGFGTLGPLGKDLAWEVSFTASANGLMALEIGLLAKNLGRSESRTTTEE